MIRALATAAAVVVALPTIAAAQQGRPFKVAWFWGVKAGGMTFADSGGKYKQGALTGIEWLITRTRGGLYVSAGEAFLSGTGLVQRDPSVPDSGFRAIRVKNVRRADFAIMGFPGQSAAFHPYAGIGFTLNAIADADPVGTFSSVEQADFTRQQIQEQKVKIAPLFIGGAQWRLHYFSVFGQLTANPAQRDFLLYNGRPFYMTYELGLRYNVGTSIEKDR
jgi:hypothetical protein